MKTYELAKKLNGVEILSIKKELQARCNIQPFEYVLVLDFEATCWDQNDCNRNYSEIIEFPCVVYNVRHNQIITEFQKYVMPVENPKLSVFCKNLTGIQQTQVDNGVPLGTCLILFNRWLREQEQKYNFSSESNKCIAATWSDWDLGTCLRNECRRKNIKFPNIFNNWMDVRVLYREYYVRRPKGLCGALTEVGLKFEGKEHCGLHDARNTANLISRMIVDGVLLRKTKSIVM